MLDAGYWMLDEGLSGEASQGEDASLIRQPVRRSPEGEDGSVNPPIPQSANPSIHQPDRIADDRRLS
ncbi:MAG: hypothetical protein JEZ11_25810 [Desulfobacterales bacterium]|nr:hypothetical protein [Desulfobacterales bacterium]